MAGVAEVVEAEIGRKADRRAGPAPLAAESAAPERCSPLADEEQTIGAVLGEPVEVTLDVGVEEAREIEGCGCPRPTSGRPRRDGRWSAREGLR